MTELQRLPFLLYSPAITLSYASQPKVSLPEFITSNYHVNRMNRQMVGLRLVTTVVRMLLISTDLHGVTPQKTVILCL
jgi:hypothetical protein